jgi:hypothetical protein
VKHHVLLQCIYKVLMASIKARNWHKADDYSRFCEVAFNRARRAKVRVHRLTSAVAHKNWTEMQTTTLHKPTHLNLDSNSPVTTHLSNVSNRGSVSLGTCRTWNLCILHARGVSFTYLAAVKMASTSSPNMLTKVCLFLKLMLTFWRMASDKLK